MKLPRDLSGRDFTRLVRRFGYEIVRQEGSHIRLASNCKGKTHHITIPDHDVLKVGTLTKAIQRIADYLEMEPSELRQTLFGS